MKHIAALTQNPVKRIFCCVNERLKKSWWIVALAIWIIVSVTVEPFKSDLVFWEMGTVLVGLAVGLIVYATRSRKCD